jgi:hypothetical protein
MPCLRIYAIPNFCPWDSKVRDTAILSADFLQGHRLEAINTFVIKTACTSEVLRWFAGYGVHNHHGSHVGCFLINFLVEPVLSGCLTMQYANVQQSS